MDEWTLLVFYVILRAHIVAMCHANVIVIQAIFTRVYDDTKLRILKNRSSGSCNKICVTNNITLHVVYTLNRAILTLKIY